MNPPPNNEIELSLFGPGVGECIIVHLGNGNWMVVDSCWNAERKRSIALEYLEKLDVDITSKIKLAVVTHWHDDHIGGFADIVRNAPSAKLACSAALRCEEFFTLIAADRDVKFVEHTSGVSEFADILNILNQRANGRYAPGPDHWAVDGCSLYSDENLGVRVWALSPSAQTITDSKRLLEAYFPSTNNPIRRFYTPGPNELSVALMVQTPNINLLLGADLETGADKKRGWCAVIDSGVRPMDLNHIYKVAHHGSENACIKDIWEKLLATRPLAILAPYARGPKPLPSSGDILRIKQHTDKLYCTAWPITKAPPKRDAAVERTMRETVRSHRTIRRQPGHIRVRIPLLAFSENR